MNDMELLRYSRHILLEDFDIAAQDKVLEASVLIVGAGGLGCPAAMYLASSGVGHIIVCDDDVVELSNLQRQIGHTTEAIKKNKVSSLAETILALNPSVKVTEIRHRMSDEEIEHWISQVDVVLDCSDNFATRFLINKVCVRIKKPLVSGAAIRSEGQLTVFDARNISSPCYCCLYSDEITQENGTCSTNGVLAPLVGVVGSLQAAEALKIIGNYGVPSIGKLLVMDLKQNEWRQLTIKKDNHCHVCSKF